MLHTQQQFSPIAFESSSWMSYFITPFYVDISTYLVKFVLVMFVSANTIQLPKSPFTQGGDLLATFQRPENWPGHSVVAQTQKVLLLCNCCSTTLVHSLHSLNHQNCCSGTLGRAKEAEWCRTITTVTQGLPLSANGSTVVATVISQWTLLIGQRRYNGGTREADASPKLIHNVYNSTHFLQDDQWPTPGNPFCDHGDACASPLPPSATCERPASSVTFVQLFWTCTKFHRDHGEAWASSVPPLQDEGNVSASFVPSTATWSVFWSHKGGTGVADPV